jgi:hypothetical protein
MEQVPGPKGIEELHLLTNVKEPEKREIDGNSNIGPFVIASSRA